MQHRMANSWLGTLIFQCSAMYWQGWPLGGTWWPEEDGWSGLALPGSAGLAGVG